jgi:hypothetical protein
MSSLQLLLINENNTVAVVLLLCSKFYEYDNVNKWMRIFQKWTLVPIFGTGSNRRIGDSVNPWYVIEKSTH